MDQEKDMNVREQKKLSILNRRNAFSVFLIKKTEKITAAIHLLSDFFSEQDPLRIELRSTSLQLLSRTLSGSHQQKEEAVLAVHSLISYLQVAYFAMRISEMNWLLLKKELESLLVHYDSRFNREGEALLSYGFFEGDTLPDPLNPLTLSMTARSNTSGIFPSPSDFPQGQDNKGQYKTLIKHTYRTQNSVLKNEPVVKDRSAVKISKNIRKDEVLNFFKRTKNNEVSIKDITAVIKDCSEKTIQRELLGLVEENVLKKTGERRWSRYSLVS